ncbi:MAG: MopE-related protein [Planctomycetota bacterium]
MAQECTPEAPAEDDATCDRADDDCDGAFDEDFEPVDITCGRGICTREGTAICRFGRTIDLCQPGIPRFERCDNDLDDDCDGRVDEDRCAGDD